MKWKINAAAWIFHSSCVFIKYNLKTSPTRHFVLLGSFNNKLHPILEELSTISLSSIILLLSSNCNISINIFWIFCTILGKRKVNIISWEYAEDLCWAPILLFWTVLAVFRYFYRRIEWRTARIYLYISIYHFRMDQSAFLVWRHRCIAANEETNTLKSV